MSSRVLIIGKVWPEPNSSAAGSRMIELIESFHSASYEISFASTANESEFNSDLLSLGVKKFSIELNSSSFDRFIKDLDPEIVLFDRFTSEEQFGWRVAEHCPNTLRLLDTEDLHCLRAARQIALKEKREFNLNDLLNDVSKREIASIYRCDLSLIISDFEMELLRDFFKVDPSLVYYLPFLLNPITNEDISQWPSFEKRQHFVSIGNFLHEPNWDAVLYLKKEIWPLIRKQLPKAEIHVYGAYPSQKVFELHNTKEGFVIKGRAENVNDVMSSARVCLAPLRFGAGLKGKLIDAMKNGTPSVTTSIGAEAMHGKFNWPGKIANTTDDFANAAVELYSTENEWKKTQENSTHIINELFSASKHKAPFLEKIKFLKNNLTAHRQKNFTGAMLMHHTASSSRYMAMWIEEKNRRL